MLDQEDHNRLIRALAEGKIEWVRRPTKDGKKGYFRRTPYTYKNPTAAQAEARLRFSEISYSLFGMLGTVDTPDRREIPAKSERLGREMAGQKFCREKKLTNVEKILMLI